MENSNPTLEKYELIRNISENNMPAQEVGKKLAEIDYRHRHSDEKLLETICRKGGKALMMAGLLSAIGNISVNCYQVYRNSLNNPSTESQSTESRELWTLGSILLAYLGAELYVRRRIEWDQFENNSK